MDFKFYFINFDMFNIIKINQKCLEWSEWKEFKSDSKIRFRNSALESIAYLAAYL